MGALAESREMLIGPAVVEHGAIRRDLRGGVWYPSHRDLLTVPRIIEHGVDHILLAEKCTAFNLIREGNAPVLHRCLLLCGSGYPSRAFRCWIRQLSNQLDLPLLILTDNDPAGLDLVLLMARGDGGKRFTRSPKLLGLRSEDCAKRGFPDWIRIDLSEQEIEYLQQISRRPEIRRSPAWQAEIASMRANGFKIEVEGTAAISMSYLAQQYLPARLSEIDLLEAPAFIRE
jgi:DNA topoisomerase VI subunit A